jgi:hypothetical protein
MNVTEALRKIFSQPQPQVHDESMITSQKLYAVLQQLVEYRREVMISPDYHADFVPIPADMLKQPKILWAHELVNSLTTKIEFITELLKTPDQISEQRLERVMRALFWHYNAIVSDNKLDDARYYELLDNLNHRTQVVALLLHVPRSRVTEVLMIITYYHAGIRNSISTFYPIVHTWINKSEETLKTLPLPPDVLFNNQEQQFVKRTGSLPGLNTSPLWGVKRTQSLPHVDGAVDGLA